MYSFRNDYNLIIAPPSVYHNNATSFRRLQCSGIVYDNFNSEGSRSLIRNHIGGGRLMISFGGPTLATVSQQACMSLTSVRLSN